MNPTLDLRQSQRVLMAPQLQQAIKLLQMSSVELNEEIRQAYETNPVLDMPDGQEQGGLVHANDNPPGRLDPENRQLNLNNDRPVFDEDQLPLGEKPLYPTAREWATTDETGYGQPFGERPASLKEFLQSQLQYLLSDSIDRGIAQAIIQHVNDAGYLETPLEEIRQALLPTVPVPSQRMETILRSLHQLEPVGVLARSPCECLLLQLKAMQRDHPGYQVAFTIIDQHLDLLARKDFTQLKKRIGISDSALKQGIDLIYLLNPHPGYSVGSVATGYLIPDVLVEHRQGHWSVRLNTNALPRLMINQDYQRLISHHAGRAEFKEMKQQLQSAKWLLTNLNKRHSTIHAVAEAIVERQQAYFDFGAAQMRPLILKDIAASLGIHESTVSRATSGKYMLTPHGMVELKYFFSSRVRSVSGESTSSVAIRALIRQILSTESPTKPASDNRISVLLKQKGYDVARRTVTKYREQMAIPASSKRKIR